MCVVPTWLLFEGGRHDLAARRDGGLGPDFVRSADEAAATSHGVDLAPLTEAAREVIPGAG